MAGVLKFLKARTIEIATGLVSSAIFAYLTVPDQQLQLGAIGLGIMAIPLFLGLASLGAGLFGLYLLVKIVEILGTKLHLFDLLDIN